MKCITKTPRGYLVRVEVNGEKYSRTFSFAKFGDRALEEAKRYRDTRKASRTSNRPLAANVYESVSTVDGKKYLYLYAARAGRRIKSYCVGRLHTKNDANLASIRKTNKYRDLATDLAERVQNVNKD